MFSHSCQWIWSVQTLESHSLAGCVFSHSCQYFHSVQTLESNSPAECNIKPFSSVVDNCLYTGELLTHWMYVQTFLLLVLLCSKVGKWLTHWMVYSHSQWFWSAQELEWLTSCAFSHSCQWFWSAQKPRKNLLSGYIFSHSISGTDPSTIREQLTRWMGVPPVSSVIHLLNYWRATYNLDVCSAIVNGSDLQTSFKKILHSRSVQHVDLRPHR